PFFIGRIDPLKGFVHVLDDTTVDILLNTLDTIADFVAYLQKKEEFLRGGRNFIAAGEEELLAAYLSDLNKTGDHDFVFPKTENIIVLDEGFWDEFVNSPQRRDQIAADKVSYFWDFLTERFNKHLLEGTQYASSHTKISDIEIAHRFLARETRFHRRGLSKTFLDLIATTPPSVKAVRVIKPSQKDEPYYFFLLMPFFSSLSSDEYRKARGNLLEIYCRVIKFRFSDAVDIIGIATETASGSESRSEDLMYFDARNWTEDDNIEARDLQEELQLFADVKVIQFSDDEYPIESASRTVKKRIDEIGRNELCFCGSGKKYKKCCMRKPKKLL
ncbi:MAG: SEC-C domain-containing protein, partial [Chloroflexota bacterium]